MSHEPPRLKRAVIKEELVELARAHIQDAAKPHIVALILNQFLYWTERTKDFDAFIIEEKARNALLDLEPTAGWIYKNAEELADELMIDVSAVTVRREIGRIVSAGYLEERHNPKYKWDRTIQYRVNLVKIQHDLQWLGYALEGYPLLDPEATFKMKVRSNTVKVGSDNMKVRVRSFEAAIPETTTETTYKEGGNAPATQDAPPQSEQTNATEAPQAKRQREPKARQTGWPGYESIPADWLAYGEEHRPDLDPVAVFEDFKGKAIAKGYTYVNWKQAWQNWIRGTEAKPYLIRKTGQSPQPATRALTAAERIKLNSVIDNLQAKKQWNEAERYQAILKGGRYDPCIAAI